MCLTSFWEGQLRKKIALSYQFICRIYIALSNYLCVFKNTYLQIKQFKMYHLLCLSIKHGILPLQIYVQPVCSNLHTEINTVCFYWIEFLMYHNFIITTVNQINLGSSGVDSVSTEYSVDIIFPYQEKNMSFLLCSNFQFSSGFL